MPELSDRTKQMLADFEEFDAGTRDTLTVYMEGLFYASVCTSLDDAEADAAMARRPGTRWERADEPFETGEPNPCPCDTDPAGRRHILYAAMGSSL
jgi:hypothetical protein